MLKAIIAVTVLCLVSHSSIAANRDDILKGTEMWAPIDVRIVGKKAEIILPQKRITDRIYLSVIGAGVCTRLIAKPNSLDGIEEISVLNQFAYQGYVFEGGTELCKKLNKMPLGKSKEIYLLGFTHLH
ncbi:MAG: hypothetical protein RH946_00790 [Rhodospirillales bacterium]